MRSVVLLDNLIPKDKALALLDEYTEFFEKHTGVQPDWYVERYDFSRVPTKADATGDLLPTREWRKAVETEVHKRYGDYGVDNILLWVHEEHFTFRGYWGVNWSYNFYKYSTQLCRWDKDNAANTFGTLYHEQMHSFDMLCLKETGTDLNRLFGVNYDKFIVHGGRPDQVGTTKWQYINHKQNTEALDMIAEHIKEAYAKRKTKHKDSLLRRVIELLQRLIASLK